MLEIDLGCVMCLRCAMQTGRGVARRALAEWGWLRADACGLFELYPHLGALPLCGFERPASDRVIAKDAQAVLEKICRASRRGGRRQARL